MLHDRLLSREGDCFFLARTASRHSQARFLTFCGYLFPKEQHLVLKTPVLTKVVSSYASRIVGIIRRSAPEGPPSGPSESFRGVFAPEGPVIGPSGALAALKVVLVTADGKKRMMQGREKGIKQGAGEWQTNLWVIGGDGRGGGSRRGTGGGPRRKKYLTGRNRRRNRRRRVWWQNQGKRD